MPVSHKPISPEPVSPEPVLLKPLTEYKYLPKECHATTAPIGRARSDTVVGTGDHPDRAGISKLYTIQLSAVGERARVRGLDAPSGWLRGGGQAVSAMRATGYQNLGSRARAFRKYACDASAQWETAHAGQKERRAEAVSNRVLATKAKRYTIGLDAKKITRIPPQVGHRQTFTAVGAVGGICRISIAAQSDASDWQLCFCAVPIAKDDKGHDLYGAPRHIIEWGHLVATLPRPSDEGGNALLYSQDER
eukprot:6210909-Pleurochrysis_carterae.AAC.2